MVSRLRAVALVFLVAVAVLYLEARSSPFEADESFYTATSRYFGYLFLQRDVTREEWGDNYMTRTQPPLTRYIVGAWLTAWGHDLETLNQPYVSTASSFEVNVRKGRVPDDLVLARARQPMVLLGAASVAVLYLLGTLLGGLVGGLAVAALALGSPFLRYTLVHAWAEAPLAFFLTSSLLLAAFGARHLAAGGRWYRWGLALGLALGLATSAKLTGGIAVAVVGAWALAGIGRGARRRRRPAPGELGSTPIEPARSIGLASLLAVVVAALVFVGLNPYLWRGPIAGTMAMLRQRSAEIVEQQAQWPEYAVLDVGSRPLLTITESLRIGPWAESPLGVAVNLALVAAGLAWLLRLARRRQAPPGGWLGPAVLLSWLAVHLVVVAWGLGLRYPRYFLPTCLLLLPIAGLGVSALIGTVRGIRAPRIWAARPRDEVAAG